MPSPRYPKPGTVVLGKYRVEAMIGEGGMGAVVKAYHIDLEEPVAIKVLLPEMLDRQEIVQRFLREAKAAVKLKGEHVARVLDVGRLDADVDGNFEGVPYIVMEYLEGSDLNAIVKHYGPQHPTMAVDLMLQACEAIAEAHSIGIVHRDIKASNFFITMHDGAPPTLKVLDFGIATTPKGTSELTDGGQVVGTPAYMAPEQMRSSRLADARSDVWSMGVVLYEMLEGARPFRADAYSDLCLRVGMDPPEPMVQQAVPEGLRAVVMKCLEKTVERRYQSVAELAFDLMSFASDSVLARASVEQCARMLSRRTRPVDVSRMPDDVTPASNVPPRLTPPAFPRLSAPAQSPISSSHSTPAESKGQVGAPSERKRHALVGVASFVVAGALTGVVALLLTRGSDEPVVHDDTPSEIQMRAELTPPDAAPDATPDAATEAPFDAPPD
ncbi:MAG TPA: serine/threonine-protein kinase [Kofleriaceae bacterium]|nr:serine/threonine-protein kinase [Kofleriaceae bacterium]